MNNTTPQLLNPIEIASGFANFPPAVLGQGITVEMMEGYESAGEDDAILADRWFVESDLHEGDAPAAGRQTNGGAATVGEAPDLPPEPPPGVTSDIDTRTVTVTFFPNKSAQTQRRDVLTLPQLAEQIRLKTGPSKLALPLLKLQRFGDKRTDKNCLRHNGNVLEISGIEVEHDKGEIAFDTAIAVMRKARIRSLLYTSPSYLPAATEKWRVLLPTSNNLPPDMRAILVARVNGLFGGKLASESFVLSQAFYYGSVNGNPAHRVEVVNGDFIDLRSDLDPGALGKDAKPARGQVNRLDGHKIEIAEGFKHFDFQRLGQNVEYPTADIEEIRSAALAIPPAVITDEPNWMSLARALAWQAKQRPDDTAALWEILDAVSRQAPKYNEDDNRCKFERYIDEAGTGEKTTTISTLFFLAREHGWQGESPQPPPLPENNLFQSSAEFVAGFTPPDYLIDGLLQRRYVYSFTAKTGDGKTTIALLLAACVARGTALAGREVEKGRVLFFAGENPDDVRSRWIILCEVLGEDPDQMDVVFMPFTLNLSHETIRTRIDAEAAKAGPFSLLIVDTSASYYSGDDENDNVALGRHANMLRTFVDLPGGPTILVTCHPTKNPDMTNLLPRGAGAFLAAVDGNLVAIKDTTTMLVEVTTHGKFRGPDFAPFAFQLMPSTSLKLVDSKGRLVWSIYAQAASNTEQETLKQAERVERGLVLQTMRDHPDYSLTDIAKHWGWSTGKGEPSKQKVHRLMSKLQKAKLVEQDFGGGYKLTPKGQRVAKELPKLPDGPIK